MKKFIAGVLVTLSILMVGCSKTPELNDSEKTVIENQDVFKGTIKDLIEKQDNLICSFTFEDETTKEEGTTYIYNGKMKSTAKVYLKKENINIESYSVTKEDFTYTRSNLENSQGVKFKNLKKEESEKYKEDPLNDKEINFICKEDANIDESTFEVPSNISFIDITEHLLSK